jgi:succinoglycan biosynthesis protein ExoV|tara:strand:+ start:283 stop:1167 length:885 start_codon:yes stop_codon:yes gene_type:complete
MKLCYYHDNEGNFGDDLNAWLWPKLLPGIIQGTAKHGDEYYEENNREAALLYGIGTILDQRIPPLPMKFIAGSGVGYFSPPTIDEKYNIYFVRGPQTAEKLGIDPTKALTDPAILLREFIPEAEKIHEVSLIMHCDTAKSGYWKNIANDLGIHHIDPRAKDPLIVINDLLASKYVITESLHGAIIADAYGIPWRPINTMPHINQFKWHDWCQSINVVYEPANLVSIFDDRRSTTTKTLLNKGKSFLARQQLKRLIKEGKSFNSNPAVIRSHTSQMLERLAQLTIDANNLQDRLK